MSTVRAWYNENDPKAAAWLRELIAQKQITDGLVDERSIVDVRPEDLSGFTRCHFFAGIGGWDHALNLAEWGDRPVWTGSCPCQPFSVAGKRKGTADDRHLWPEFYRLIAACRPAVVFGEQVASPDGRQWLLRDTADMQRMSDRKTLIRVWAGYQAPEAAALSGVRAATSAGAQPNESNQTARALSSVAREEPRRGLGDPGAAEGQVTRMGMYDQSEVGPSCDCKGVLPVDGHPIQLVGREDVGQPVHRSDRLDSGLHAGEYTGGALLRECDGEYLGSESDFDHSVGYSGPADDGQRELDALFDRAVDGDTPSTQSSVSADLERIGYAVGATDLGAASLGAPHLRRRLWFVAESQTQQHGTRDARRGRGESADGSALGVALGDANPTRSQERVGDGRVQFGALGAPEGEATLGGGDARSVAYSQGDGWEKECPDDRRGTEGNGQEGRAAGPESGGDARGVADTSSDGTGDSESKCERGATVFAETHSSVDGVGDPQHPLGRSLSIGLSAEDAPVSFWIPCDWIPCRDGKSRPVEPGTFPLAHGVSARVGRLRGYGNAIVPQVAATFIRAYRESR